MTRKPRIEIEFCTQCRWLLRAAWLAQELLTTFEQEIGEVALIPGTGGVFEVRGEGALLWSRKQEGRFPEAKELKQRLRDLVAPDKPWAIPSPKPSVIAGARVRVGPVPRQAAGVV
ncbi:SelT/SelW/SelH family protein [Methylogaea oryzae]|uniref:SelT/SelW/SelH family protein n=1 Tax=Methylogaea oryzae TaxID=1295382 RepID=UPI0009E66621|nr:SelT/SelW/SelH family protein [Methylogaea oryzae]